MTDKDINRVEVVKRFGECPWCGSTERMMEELAEELREAGRLREDMQVGLNEVGGPIVDPAKMNSVIVGGLLPAVYALRDICMGCGREITVQIERKPVEATAVRMQGKPGKMPPFMGRG